MSVLFDTNVISEWTKPQPSAGVIAWLEETDEDRVFPSVAALAELRQGPAGNAIGARRVTARRDPLNTVSGASG
jgi:toxin FitB